GKAGAADLVSAEVAALGKGVLRTMGTTKLTIAAVLLAGRVLGGAGVPDRPAPPTETGGGAHGRPPQGPAEQQGPPPGPGGGGEGGGGQGEAGGRRRGDPRPGARPGRQAVRRGEAVSECPRCQGAGRPGARHQRHGRAVRVPLRQVRTGEGRFGRSLGGTVAVAGRPRHGGGPGRPRGRGGRGGPPQGPGVGPGPW